MGNTNEIHEINISSNRSFCDTHAEKYNTTINSDPSKVLVLFVFRGDSTEM